MNIGKTVPVLGAPIDATSWDAALSRIAAWATARESRYVCICNAHSVVTTRQDAAFGQVVAQPTWPRQTVRRWPG